MPRALIALGANLGDRRQTLARAVEAVSRAASLGEPRVSAWHPTAPVGGPAGQEEFLNAAMSLETQLAPHALHALLKRTEQQLGRTPDVRWAARVLDLDLLLYDAEVIDEPQLQLPHPRMTFRHFVLAPAAEVAAEMVHPLSGWNIGELLTNLTGTGCYVALLAPPGFGKTALAQRLAADHGGHFLAAPDTIQVPCPGGDPSGPVFLRQIQFLDRVNRWQAEQLGSWLGADSPRLVVSDFYADQSLAYAASELNPPDWPRWQSEWEQRPTKLLKPRLLVVLDNWSAAVAVWRGETPAADNAFAQCPELRREMLRLALRRHGPAVLFAGSSDPPRQRDEITAAIEAMRPGPDAS